jgi:hypothetical protein
MFAKDPVFRVPEESDQRPETRKRPMIPPNKNFWFTQLLTCYKDDILPVSLRTLTLTLRNNDWLSEPDTVMGEAAESLYSQW